MRPAGVTTSRATLDALKTKRPILVRSSFGHTVLANSRALMLAKITAATPDPVGGKIWRDAAGEPTGLLEDAALDALDALLPKPTAAQDVEAAAKALDAMKRQGVTSSWTPVQPQRMSLRSRRFARAANLRRARTSRRSSSHPRCDNLTAAVARVSRCEKEFDEGPISRAPGITVRNAKLFLDGVISAPALTGAMLEPYRRNAGTADQPNWVAGTSRGPDVYFPPKPLATSSSRSGAPASIRTCMPMATALCAPGSMASRRCAKHCPLPISARPSPTMRSSRRRLQALPGARCHSRPVISMGEAGGRHARRQGLFRPGAHEDPRTRRLARRGGRADSVRQRLARGCAGRVVRVQSRRDAHESPEAPPEYRGRLGDDPGLSRETVLRAATINAAYELHQDDVTGRSKPASSPTSSCSIAIRSTVPAKRSPTSKCWRPSWAERRLHDAVRPRQRSGMFSPRLIGSKMKSVS